MVDDEARLLREAGHEVVLWDPEPVPPDRQGVLGLLRTGSNAIWSRDAQRALGELIGSNDTQVVHLHNLLPELSPAVIRTADAAGVPVVCTLHNYRLLCLPATLELDQVVCERCVGHVPIPGVIHACYRGSHLGSAVVATSLVLHRALGTFGKVRRFLPVSRFVLEMYERAGFDPRTMQVKSNFAWGGAVRKGAGSHFLYAGRLSREKGLDVVLRAWEPDLGTLLVAGPGPEEARLRERSTDGVEFLGTVTPDRVQELMMGARAVVVPSRWFETSGRVVIEAGAAGVPVIASRIGALPEAIDDGSSGQLVDPDDVAAWHDAIRSLLDDDESVRLGRGALDVWRSRYTPDRALTHLESIYAEAVG